MQKEIIKVLTNLARNTHLVVLLIAFSAFTVSAQQVTVKGVIKDETGTGVIGANILELGTDNGTITDIDGGYTLIVAKDATIKISYTGYVSKEVLVGSGGTFDVNLEVDSEILEEVVVTGYQIQRKRDISGAVSVINTGDIQNLVTSSFAQKLQGRAPGVTVSTSGAPGSAANVRIRGISSFGNNDPLYVIDGVPVQDKGNLNINPNDIESMQVLKDPSTASIYGSRASNGVIVITTKKGKTGKPRFTYNGSLSSASAVKGWNDILILNSNEYVDMTKQFYTNGGLPLPSYARGTSLPKYIYVRPELNTDLTFGELTSVANTVDLSLYDRYTNPIMETSAGTDWWDVSTRSAMVQDHSFSVSGGTENLTYAVGAGILQQEGILKYNEFNRYNVRANTLIKVSDKFRIGENLNFAYRTDVNNPAISEQGTISAIYKSSPLAPVYDIGNSVGEDGERDSFGGTKTADLGNSTNPLARLYRGRNNVAQNMNILGNLFAEFDIISGLTLKTDFKLDMGSGYSRAFSYRTPENQEGQGGQNFREDWGTGRTWTWTNTANYQKQIGEKHSIGALIGYEALHGKGRNISGNLNDYFTVSEDAWYLNTGFGDATSRGVSSNGGENKLLSTFGKVDYAYNDKYFISATIRRDGSSRFSPANRYAVFPAFSAGWRISGEDFLKNNSIFSDLKLRASWGKTGNENIRPYNYVNQWGGSIASAFYDINGNNNSSVTGFHQTFIGDPNTKWEEGINSNIGIDASLFNDKVSLVVDVYKRVTSDLLYNAAFPGSAGEAGVPFRNIAQMTNTGIDLGLGYKDKVNSDFSYSIDLNISHYKNVIDKTDGVTEFFYPNSAQGRIDNRLQMEFNINQIGESISSFRGYIVEGIYDENTTADELSKVKIGNAVVGGLRFKDINGDGDITEEDATIIGSPHPSFTGGLNLGVTYKNFDLSAFFVGSYGNEIFNYVKLFTHFRQFNSNVDREYFLNNGKDGNPRLNVNDTASKLASTYYVEDGSYFRLGQLQIGYNIPLSSKNKVGMKNLKVYVQGQNLFTITGYSGLDPALSNANIGDFQGGVQGNFLNDLWTGFDLGQYPSNKMFTVGVNAEF
ncbi:MAG TPA: TonB-dependent receptor [Saprospiraceae bacterium]|nr:TonB-dependent receptor [Saprospiraceae bacterium]